MPFHNVGAYDGFDSFKEVLKYYKRCKNIQHFILSTKGVEKEKPVCSVCRKIITDDSNRCEYHPKRKLVFPMHYYCAWNFLFKRLEEVAVKLGY